jgi:hypothetical protein
MSLFNKLNSFNINKKDKVEAFRFIVNKIEHPLIFDYNLEVNFNKNKAINLV